MGGLLFVSWLVFREPFVPVDAGPKGRPAPGLNPKGRNEMKHRPGQEIWFAMNARHAQRKFLVRGDFRRGAGPTARDGKQGAREMRHAENETMRKQRISEHQKAETRGRRNSLSRLERRPPKASCAIKMGRRLKR